MLVLTTFENDDYVFDALRAGASGFLLKRAAPDELVRAIRVVAAAESLLFPPRSANSRPATPRKSKSRVLSTQPASPTARARCCA